MREDHTPCYSGRAVAPAPAAQPELTDFQRKQLLDFVQHHMDQTLRGKIMDAMPQAYNAWVGRAVLSVVHTSDGRVR